ncbi:hypothetical protein Mal4_39680 [Maioricimonas rarisocia]|uniref:Uncharacterized protein n=1 Tax=Maioricimonas rarisocia TaxID=2528026 RepID=A0A517ZAV2_9PLAN|nr:hypothetical protein [Maioricimonas rarisocia]QDU39622.1 hypothetical protein Mal4_39680 [Maioricimonas rarisocia]
MAFFSNRRRKLQISQIVAIGRAGIDESAVASLEDEHLGNVARVVGTAKDKKAREDVSTLLPMLLSSSRKSRELAAAMPNAFKLRQLADVERERQQAATRVREMATSLFRQIAVAVSAQLPARVNADEKKCVQLIESLMKAGTAPESLVSEFAKAFRKNPAAYIDQPSLFFAHQASEIFPQIAASFNKSLPAGARLRRKECEALLGRLMASGVEPEKLVDQFVAAVQAAPRKYVDGLNLPSAADVAADIYRQLEPQFAKALPAGCSPLRKPCVEAFEKLVDSGTPPEQIVGVFMMLVKASPATYFTMPPPPKFDPVRFASSAPVSMNRSELR